MTYDEVNEKLKELSTEELSDVIEKCVNVRSNCDGCPFVCDDDCPKQMDMLIVSSQRLRFLAQIESLWTLYKDDKYANLTNFYRDVRILIQQNEEDEKNGKTEQN